MGVFSDYDAQSYPFQYSGTITNVGKIAGGTPTDQKVAEAWIKANLGANTAEKQIHLMASRIIEERGTAPIDSRDPAVTDELAAEINKMKNLNGFKRIGGVGGVLHLEGRHLKACLKEAVSVCVAAEKLDARGWGKTNKGALSFAAEHIIVCERELPLRRNGKPVTNADGVDQRFVSVVRPGIGKVTGIQYEEIIEPGAEFDFTIKTDFEYSERTWAMIWTTAQEQGIGASRSQGYGVFEVIRWDRVDTAAKKSSPRKRTTPRERPAVAAVTAKRPRQR